MTFQNLNSREKFLKLAFKKTTSNFKSLKIQTASIAVIKDEEVPPIYRIDKNIQLKQVTRSGFSVPAHKFLHGYEKLEKFFSLSKFKYFRFQCSATTSYSKLKVSLWQNLDKHY